MVLRVMQPWPPIRQLRREMDRLLSAFSPDGSAWNWPPANPTQPAVNVWETPEAFHVELEVPGLKNDQLDLSVVGNELTLKIERPEVQQEGATYHRRERAVGTFTRVLRLPTSVDAQKVQATIQAGVLAIALPKAETARPRKIQVSGGK